MNLSKKIKLFFRKEDKSNNKLWPYEVKYTGFVISFCLLMILLIIYGILRKHIDWPNSNSESVVLIGILIISLIPIILIIIDLLFERGAKVKIGSLEFDLSQSKEKIRKEFIPPKNLGKSENTGNDDDPTYCLIQLRNSDDGLVKVDIEDGYAWWETRLVVLLAGLVRFGKPKVVVFVRTEINDQYFLGWGYPVELLNSLILEVPKYKHYLELAKVIANEQKPENSIFVISPMVQDRANKAHHEITDKLNDIYEEQILLKELKENEEKNDNGTDLTYKRLNELFREKLNKNHLDLFWSNERQRDSFLENEQEFIAITEDCIYKYLVSRIAILNELLKGLNSDSESKDDKIENNNPNNQ